MQPLPKHLPALDGLRGVAILLVVLTHCSGGWQAALSLTQNTRLWAPTFDLPRWLGVVSGEAVHGVTLFFVVSAFTLTRSLAQGADLRRYVIRRVARVAPGYWLAGIAYTLAAGLVPRLWAPDGVAPSDLVVAAVFGSAWQGGASMAVVPGGWSVSCEVAFYAALPLLLWVIQGRLWRAAALTVTASVAVQIAARHGIVAHTWSYVPQYINPMVQAPVFLCGITAALLVRHSHLPYLPYCPYVLLALAIFAVPFNPVGEWYLQHHLAFAVLAAAAVALAATRPPRLLGSAVMRRVGEVSYSMYLVHFALLSPSLWLAERLVPADHWQTLALHLLLTSSTSFVAATVLHRWVEVPGIALGRALIRRLPSQKSPELVYRPTL